MSEPMGPHDAQARRMQARADAGGQPLHGRAGQDARQADARQGERFGKSLHKAMGKTPADEVEENRAALAPSPLLPALRAEVEKPAPTTLPRAAVAEIAERIERYLRGAEGAGALKSGEGMLIRLPQNGMGLVQVMARVEGEVLHLELGLEDPARLAAMQAHIGVMGQLLGQRLPRLPLRLTLAGGGEGEVPEEAAFNPLMPRGRLG